MRKAAGTDQSSVNNGDIFVLANGDLFLYYVALKNKRFGAQPI